MYTIYKNDFLCDTHTYIYISSADLTDLQDMIDLGYLNNLADLTDLAYINDLKPLPYWKYPDDINIYKGFNRIWKPKRFKQCKRSKQCIRFQSIQIL